MTPSQTSQQARNEWIKMMIRKEQVLHIVMATLKRILLVLYVILPVSILLFAREPEITSTVSNHSQLSLVCVVGMILVAYKVGWKGFLLCLAVCLSLLIHAMDDTSLLWEPSPSLTITNNLNDKVAVITGANSGIGRATCLQMARLGAHVIVTCRSLERCQEVVKQANTVGKENGGRATAAVLDLSSLESAYNLSKQLSLQYPRIHYLFNNAGSTPIYTLTKEGLEDGFGGMHLAHMALTLGLLPSLRNAGTAQDPSRIIMTSSEASITSALGILRDEPFHSSFFLEENGQGDLRGEVTRGGGDGKGSTIISSHVAYGRAKLCNNLFAFELNRKFRKLHWPVVINTLHTGSVATTSAAKALGDVVFAFRIPGLPYIVRNVYVPLLWRSPDAGARILLYAALSNDTAVVRGGQYIDALCRPLLDDENPVDSKIVQEKMKALKRADEKWSERLWEVSLRLIQESPAKNVVEMAP